MDINVAKKDQEKVDKYQAQARAIRKMYRVRTVPIIIGALGTIPKRLLGYLKDLGVPDMIPPASLTSPSASRPGAEVEWNIYLANPCWCTLYRDGGISNTLIAQCKLGFNCTIVELIPELLKQINSNQYLGVSPRLHMENILNLLNLLYFY